MRASTLICVLCVVFSKSKAWTQYEEPFTFQCPDHKFMSTVSSDYNYNSGDRIWNFYCSSFPKSTTSSVCRWSGYRNTYRQSVQYDCPAGTYLNGMDGYTEYGKRDRKWQFSCCKNTNIISNDCFNSQDANTWRGNMHFLAKKPGYVIGGVNNVYNYDQGDRRWTFKLCRMESRVKK